MGTQLVSLPNGWNFHYCDVPETMPAGIISRAQDLLQSWRNIFPLGKTWVGRTYGVPSLFVRFDCVYSESGELRVFEIEERPCGIGVSALLNSHFRTRLLEIKEEWPPFGWICSATRPGDDELWLGKPLSLDDARSGNQLLLIRSRPEETLYHEFEERSVSSLLHEGDKRYGEVLGLWRIVRWERDIDPENGAAGYIAPPLDGACVLKPVQGTRCRDVAIYFDGQITIRKVPGIGKKPFFKGQPLIKTRADVVGTVGAEYLVRRHEEMVMQPFFMPMSLAAAPDKNGILRCYFGFSPSADGYVPLGGVWAASAALRVHGEEGTTFGPLLCET
ncbi:MAG: hypothetical protein ACRDHZ_02635 [Ktedonobacteraceae bacterium]